MQDVTDAESRTVSYEFDDLGRRKKMVYPDDSFVTYQYDAESRLTYIRDDASNVLVHYSYDELSRRTLLELGNDANAVYEYNLGNRLTSLTNNFGTDPNIKFEYTHDNVGNRETLTVDSNSTDKFYYTYDEIYQIRKVEFPTEGTSVESFTYDKLGNRSTSMGYTSNSLNQYTVVSGQNYVYDNNGNLTDDKTWKYTYDSENRLTEVREQDNDLVATYVYDYADRRIQKTVEGNPDVVTKYAYSGDQIIAEYNGSGTLLKKYVYGTGIDEVICMVNVSLSQTYYYHHDGLGNVIALSDSSKDIVERYSYDAFGNVTIRDASGTITQCKFGWQHTILHRQRIRPRKRLVLLSREVLFAFYRQVLAD